MQNIIVEVRSSHHRWKY